MIGAKQIIKFFCLFVLVYGLLMAPWPGLRTAYSRFYRASAASLFGSFGSKGIVHFRQSGNVEYDTDVLIFNRDRVKDNGGPVVVQLGINSRYGGYMSTVFLIALVAATPIFWRRKGWAMVWGMILMHSFVSLKILISILYHFANKPLSLFVLNRFWTQVLFITDRWFNLTLTFDFVVSFVIWVLVSFRREDWSKIGK